MEQTLGTRSPRNASDRQRLRPVGANAPAPVESNASRTVVDIARARQRHSAPRPSVGHLRIMKRERPRLVRLDGQNRTSTTASAPTPDAPGSATTRRGRLVQSLLLEAMARDPVADPGPAGHAWDRALDLAEQLAELFDLLAGDTGNSVLHASGSLRETLTESEMRILRLLPTNLSKREIAQELYLSVNTIKVHTRHLYAKLDAHSRREAVERARALGLLPRSSRAR